MYLVCLKNLWCCVVVKEISLWLRDQFQKLMCACELWKSFWKAGSFYVTKYEYKWQYKTNIETYGKTQELKGRIT